MYQEGRIEPGSGYSSGPTGGRTTNTSTNRTPFGSAGTDMGSGMMGNPTMGGRMLSANPSGLMPGYGFMSEPIITGSGVTPNRPRRGVIGSAGTDMGSGMMGNPTMGGEPMMVGMMGLSGTEMSTMGVRSPNVDMNLVSSEIGSIGSGQFIELNSLNNYVNLLIDNTDEIFAKSNNSINSNMDLSLTPLIPINVDENTGNLEKIQSFTVEKKNSDGTHLHQDPNTGQLYRMTNEFHSKISSNQQLNNLYNNSLSENLNVSYEF